MIPDTHPDLGSDFQLFGNFEYSDLQVSVRVVMIPALDPDLELDF